MASDIKITYQEMEYRKKLGQDVVDQIDGVAKAIDGDSQQIGVQLVGSWGTAQSAALVRIHGAVNLLRGVVERRNGALNHYTITTQDNDSNSSSMTSKSGEAASVSLDTQRL